MTLVVSIYWCLIFEAECREEFRIDYRVICLTCFVWDASRYGNVFCEFLRTKWLQRRGGAKHPQDNLRVGIKGAPCIQASSLLLDPREGVAVVPIMGYRVDFCVRHCRRTSEYQSRKVDYIRHWRRVIWMLLFHFPRFVKIKKL